MSTNEPSASYELTRDRASSGTCCWNTVNQSARWIASPVPATTCAASSTGNGTRNASIHVPEPERSRAHAGHEQRPRRMPAQRDEAAEDEPDTERRPDQPERRRAAVVLLDDEWREHAPRLSGEVADPEEDDRVEDPPLSPELGPAVAQLADERLWLDDVVAWRDVTRASSRAATAKLTASTRIAEPGLPAATSTPPSAGAPKPRIDRDSPSSAFACCSLALLTTAGMSPFCAGMTNPSARP